MKLLGPGFDSRSIRSAALEVDAQLGRRPRGRGATRGVCAPEVYRQEPCSVGKTICRQARPALLTAYRAFTQSCSLLASQPSRPRSRQCVDTQAIMFARPVSLMPESVCRQSARVGDGASPVQLLTILSQEAMTSEVACEPPASAAVRRHGILARRHRRRVSAEVHARRVSTALVPSVGAEHATAACATSGLEGAL